MSLITIPLPDSITESEARMSLAIQLYEDGRVSCGKAGEIAGYSTQTFMELISKRGISVINHSPSDLSEEIGTST